MHIYLLILNAIKGELRYKANLLGVILAIVLAYSIQFVFFDVINSLVAFEVGDGNWLLVFFVSYAIGSLVVGFFKFAITDFFGELTRGKADVLLVKPISLMVIILFRWCKAYYIIAAILFIGVCLMLGVVRFEPFWKSTFNTGVYLIVMVLGVLANLVFLLALNAFSFLTQRQLPVDYIHLSIFNFALLPSTFYSQGLLHFFVLVLPMVVFASVALDALYHGLTGLVITYGLIVVVCFALVLKMIYRLFARFDSIGG